MIEEEVDQDQKIEKKRKAADIEAKVVKVDTTKRKVFILNNSRKKKA
jgi:hypothetical protein